MDKEMMDRLIAIQMKHNPQTRIGAAIVVTELLMALREPTEAMLKADGIYTNCNTCGGHKEGYQRLIDCIIIGGKV